MSFVKEKAIFSNIINVKTKSFHSFFDCMQRKEKKRKEKLIITLALVVCFLLIFISLTPLFGVDDPVFFLIIAVPTCVILAVFGLKARYQ